MDWDIELQHLTNELGPAMQREIESSITDVERRARLRIRTSSVAVGPTGILGASPPLHEYCAAYVPNLKASDVDDIQYHLIAAGKQAVVLSGRKLQWPIVRVGDKELPIALFDESALGKSFADLGDLPRRMDIYVSRLRAEGADVFMVDSGSALHLFSDLLTPFLGARLVATRLYPAVTLRNNVVVSNNENGWNVVYRPLLLVGSQSGLGGPGSPVSGVMRPGTYIFGITKSGQPALWDSTSWNIPQRNTIHVPLP
jgi:hypothetical protein